MITDCDHDNIEPEQSVFAEAGFDVRLAECETASDVIEQAPDADALINQYAPIDETVLANLKRRRVVVRYGVGVDTVDVEAATRHSLWVVNVPDYGTEEVSEHAFALLLNLLRGVGRYDRAVRSGEWEYSAVRPLRRLRTLTVGVIGCGHIGADFARKVGCLGARVLGYDAARVPEELVHDGVVEPADLAELLARADAVSLHAPLTEQTRHLIGTEQLRLMKPGAYLVNTSRGGLVDQAALLRALDEGEIAGAAASNQRSDLPLGSGRDDGAEIPRGRVWRMSLRMPREGG